MRKSRFFTVTGIAATLILVWVLQSCTIIQPNQLGLRQRLGVLNKNILYPGIHGYNPFVAKVIKYNCKILTFTEKSQYSTNDGLEISAEMNLLYHINKDSLYNLHINLGKNFEEKFVGNLFRSVIRKEVIEYNAKDVMNKIESLEDSISLNVRPLLNQYGFVVDKVIVSDIDLPDEVNNAIKDKVRAEQVAKQKQVEIQMKLREMRFEIEKDSTIQVHQLEREKQLEESKLTIAKIDSAIIISKQKAEAQRTIIEARAQKQSQSIIDSTLSDKQLQLRKIDATEKLAASANSKLIITDGKSQLFFRADDK